MLQEINTNRGVARIFPWGGGGQAIIFIEKCSLLVDRWGQARECCIEVKQKRGGSTRIMARN